MNETGKGRGLVRNIATLAGIAVLTGVLALLEVRQAAHDNDPAVIELRAQEAKRLEAEIRAEERESRWHQWEMAILHYGTLALLLVGLVLFSILILGSMIEQEEAARHGRPAPPMPDLTLPVPIPVL